MLAAVLKFSEVRYAATTHTSLHPVSCGLMLHLAALRGRPCLALPQSLVPCTETAAAVSVARARARARTHARPSPWPCSSPIPYPRPHLVSAGFACRAPPAHVIYTYKYIPDHPHSGWAVTASIWPIGIANDGIASASRVADERIAVARRAAPAPASRASGDFRASHGVAARPLTHGQTASPAALMLCVGYNILSYGTTLSYIKALGYMHDNRICGHFCTDRRQQRHTQHSNSTQSTPPP
jgi:hypothetical protein